VGKDKGREAIAEAMIQRQLEALERLEGPYERALGKLAMRFSLLHVVLERFSWQAWNLNPSSGSVLTNDLRATHLVEKLEATAKDVIPRIDDRKKLLSILKEIKIVAKRKNDLLHSLWIIREGEPVWCFSRTRGALVGPDAPSAKQINELCSAIIKVLTDFDLFEENNPLRGKGLLGMALESDENTDK